MRSNTQQIIESKPSNSTKEIILPFIIQKPPFDNYVAYEKKGHWTEKEKLKYAIFLQFFKRKFTSKDTKKRFCRIFKVMSDFIKTRTHNQCRSHHQKMQKQKFQVDSIISNVSSKYPIRVYNQLYQKYTVQIEHLMIEQLYDQKQQNIQQKLFNNKLQHKSIKSKSFNKDIIIQKDIIMMKDKSLIKQKQKIQNDKEKIYIQREYNQKIIEQQNGKFNKNLLKTAQSFVERFHQPFTEKSYIKHPIQHNNYQLQFSPSKSLDFRHQNPYFETKHFRDPIESYALTSYLQNLEMKRLESLNKATFHYNQMQIELKNASDCQHMKSLIQPQEYMGPQSRGNTRIEDNNFKQGFLSHLKPY